MCDGDNIETKPELSYVTNPLAFTETDEFVILVFKESKSVSKIWSSEAVRRFLGVCS